MKTTTRTSLVAAALVTGLLVTACSPATDEPVHTPTASVEQTTAPAETPTAGPVPETVDPSLEVTIDGVTYTGTEDAPLKIGSDMPGQPPAVEATFTKDPNQVFPEGKTIADQKYLVVISPGYAPNDLTGEGPVTGYWWGTYAVNEYGSFKAITTHGTSKDDFDQYSTQQEAIDAPKLLNGRELDRSEYVLSFF